MVIAMVTPCVAAAEMPIWDLAKNEIPASLQSGDIERVGGEIILRDGAAFAVPADAFPDQENFTVQVTASVSELVSGTVFTVMKKQGDKDDGFSFSMNYRDEPWWSRRVSAVVNNIYMSASAINGKRGPQINTPYTFTVSVRNGFASFYIDDGPYKKCYMKVIPNNDPMWIGRNLKENAKPMPRDASTMSPAWNPTPGPNWRSAGTRRRLAFASPTTPGTNSLAYSRHATGSAISICRVQQRRPTRSACSSNPWRLPPWSSLPDSVEDCGRSGYSWKYLRRTTPSCSPYFFQLSAVG
jgi:hypothetical protein